MMNVAWLEKVLTGNSSCESELKQISKSFEKNDGWALECENFRLISNKKKRHWFICETFWIATIYAITKPSHNMIIY
jgi:hypothetical protein